MEFQKEIENLFSSQMQEWTQLRESVRRLEEVQTNILEWSEDVHVVVQFNPARVVSTAAKIDVATIGQRPCFLCENNRPKEQKGIPFFGKIYDSL